MGITATYCISAIGKRHQSKISAQDFQQSQQNYNHIHNSHARQSNTKIRGRGLAQRYNNLMEDWLPFSVPQNCVYILSRGVRASMQTRVTQYKLYTGTAFTTAALLVQEVQKLEFLL